jgi:TolA-binding protein
MTLFDNPEIIAAVVSVFMGLSGVLTAIAVYIKSRADVSAIREERKATKTFRDDDSQKMHDDIIKLQFQSQQNKDNIGLLFQQMADSNKQISVLNQQLAQVLVKMDNVILTLKELKEDFRNERT